MYPEVLDYLSCPQHAESPLLLANGVDYAPDGAIVRGQVYCSVCQAVYQISDGILDLLSSFTLPTSITQLTNMLPFTAWGYERLWRTRALTLMAGEPLGYARELPLIAGLAEAQRGGLFVDIACSNGLYARAIAQTRGGIAGPTLGIDHAMPMLRQARAFAQARGLRISYVRAKAQALPVRSGSVTGVTMGGSLNEIGNVDQALSEIRRVLAPRGRCVMMNLVEAEGRVGRILQRILGLAGVVFWSLPDINRRYGAARLRLRAQWRYGVVLFSVLI